MHSSSKPQCANHAQICWKVMNQQYSTEYGNTSSQDVMKSQGTSSTSVGMNVGPVGYSSYPPPSNQNNMADSSNPSLYKSNPESRPKARRSKSLDYLSEYNNNNYYDSGGVMVGGGDPNMNKKKRKKSFSKGPETNMNSSSTAANQWNNNGNNGYPSSSNNRRGSATNSDYGSNSPLIKRPRGRPPLNASGPVPIPFSTSSAASSVVGSTNTGGRKQSFSTSQQNANSTSSSQPPNTTNSTTAKDSKSATGNANGGNDGEPIKIPRPTYKFVVSKVLSKLMVSDPISASDLTKILPDCPKDMIHSVLEISQVLGMVIQSKAKEGLRHDYPAGTIVYSLINYVKGPTAISLDKIEADIEQRVEKEKKAALRMAELHALSEQQMSVEDRREALRSLVIKFLSNQNDPSVKDVPLYRSILESLDPHNPLLANF